jgi:hypothetical protein
MGENQQTPLAERQDMQQSWLASMESRATVRTTKKVRASLGRGRG